MNPTSQSLLDFLLTPHGTLLVIVVGGGRNDPRWLRVQDDNDDVYEEYSVLQAALRSTDMTATSVSYGKNGNFDPL